MKWNERLRYEREAQGWSQSSVAKELGTQASTISRWENGMVFPSPFYRERLSQLFGKSVEELGLVRLVPESDSNGRQHYHIPSSSLQYLPVPHSGTLTEERETFYTPSDLPPFSQDWEATPTEEHEISYISSDLPQLPEDQEITPTEECKEACIPSGLLQQSPYLQKRRWFLKGLGIGIATALVAGASLTWFERSTPPPKKIHTHPLPKVINIYKGHSARVTGVSWSSDGIRIASSSWDSTVQVWNAMDGKHASTYHNQIALSAQAWAVAWSPNSQFLVSGYKNNNDQVWQFSDDKDNASGKLMSIHHDYDSISAVAWSPDNRYVASSSWNNTVRIWLAKIYDDPKAYIAHNHLTYHGHYDRVNAVAWSPNEIFVASASRDQTVQIWRPGIGNTILTYRSHRGSVNAVVWSPDGRWIASAGQDTTIHIWNAMTGETVVAQLRMLALSKL